MKKLVLSLSTLFLSGHLIFAQVANRVLNKASNTVYDAKQELNFIEFNSRNSFASNETQKVLSDLLQQKNCSFELINKETDTYGFTHEKFSVHYNGILVNDAVIIVHNKNGNITSINGQLSAISEANNAISISETNALQVVKSHLKVKTLKADNKQEEAHMRHVLNNPQFSYTPKTETVLYKVGEDYRYAYKVSIYVEEPLFNGYVFVDTQTGNVLGQQSLICTIDVPATANTKYSGTQNFINDQFAGGYRLRESQRGLGIETYNLNNTSNYGTSTDFVNASTTWTTTGVDQAATDAHWGAEQTYDYFQLVHNRNSIDNNGFKLLSYLHYNTNFNNAFWDGLRMTYGDGNGSTFTILTALDVCGHEISHGLVQKSAGLNGGGTGEADALNEAFADIFGTSIERKARPNQWNWKIGSDMTPNGNGIRNMQNPNLLNDPDTYLGTFWDNGGQPHNNAGPAIYWFYLLNQGGSGTNDLNNAYNVTGLGALDAEKIAFRALTVYFTPGTTYNLARTYCVQAARDLFGACSIQEEQTAKAWYAVGVGGPYSNNVIAPNFTAPIVSFCNLPATVNFNNTTSNALTYNWSFGDGNSSSAQNPSHTYTANGTYNVKLSANGCNFAVDSITKTAYVVINAPTTPIVNPAATCINTSIQLTATGNAQLQWYNNSNATGVPLATGANYSTPTLTTSTTYYVVNSVISAPAFGGIVANNAPSTSGGFLTNAAQWLVFDVLQPCSLKTVVVYAQAAGVRSIQLKNGLNAIINTTTANLVAGANTVTLNYPLVTGPNFQLGLTTGSTANLFRTNIGVSYPYNIGGCVNLKNSSAGTGFYYWFYNWEVQKDPCTSGIIPVNVTVNQNPSTSLSVSTPSVCPDNSPLQLNGLPVGGTYSGNGIVGNTFNPSVGAGTYPIKYTYTDGNGCKDSTQLNLFVVDCTGLNELSLASSVSIYPNPTNRTCFIENKLAKTISIVIYDALGKIVKQISTSETLYKLDVLEISNGIYTLQINEQEKSIGRYKLIKN